MNKEIKKIRTVLVIEDEPSLLKVIVAKLSKSGFKVVSARSVDQAFNPSISNKEESILNIESIEKILKHLESLEKIEAIWLDHQLLGKEDGLDFVKKFKLNGSKWRKIPIFVVSNAGNPKTIKAYVDSGVSKYYVKSDYRLEKIIADIKEVLGTAKK
jgi:CheY-like chemotaxis protein